MSDVGDAAGKIADEANSFTVADTPPDPLADLAERAKSDPGAPFKPDALTALKDLRRTDRPAFETLRKRFREAGVRVTVLDEAIDGTERSEPGRKRFQADTLVEIAQSVELFHVSDGTGFADVDVDDHRETWPIRAKGFRRWLVRQFFETTGGAPGSDALQSALDVIEAKAQFDAPERAVHIRVGAHNGKLYLDLCNEKWQAIEIDDTGWRVIDDPPVRFRRTAGMLPLPNPEPGGSINKLRRFLNVRTEADFVLAVSWLLGAFRHRGPYPLLVLAGEQGSAKSTFAAILRALIDPNAAALRALPREEHDFFIAANNSHVQAFENLSGLPPWASDTLCRLATGAGFATRRLYSDQDEVLLVVVRPVILNGIEDIVSRADLADRAVFLTLNMIPDDHRLTEIELWTAFDTERPSILGALLDAVAEGMKRLPNTHLVKLPRMADFALWVTACETAFWQPGTFWSAYSGNRDEAVESVIEGDLVATAVRAFMMALEEWKGTASDLLGILGDMAGERTLKSKSWPKSPRGLSGRLRRAATFLRKVGVEIDFDREGHGNTRTITITATPTAPSPEQGGEQPSAPSAPPTSTTKMAPANDTAEPDRPTIRDNADGRIDGRSQTVRVDPSKSNSADHADANPPHQSAPEKWRVRL
jgi:hypothetical protein